MKDSLQTTLRQLRLSGLAQTLDVRLQEAASHNLSHVEFLELILQDELLVRDERQINRRVKWAAFRELKPLDEFDFAFNPAISRKQVFDLATCRFVREHRDVLLMGPPEPVKVLSPRPSGIRPSSKASPFCTARSSMWSATFCTRKCSGRTTRCSPDISNPIWL